MAELNRIGLLSDSHGHSARTASAVRLLLEAGAELLVHLGDVGSEEVLESLLAGLDEQQQPQPPVHLVFGNTDPISDLARYALHLGIQNHHPAGTLTLAGGKLLVFTHGDNHSLLESALTRKVNYLCHGHTHQRRNDLSGPTRLINPGALVRCDKPTCCLLEADTGQVRFMDVPP